VKGFFSVELLLVSFLVPYLIFLGGTDEFRVLRETEVLAQDVAEAMVAGVSVNEIQLDNLRVWIDGAELGNCEYNFRYCTLRYYDGGEHSVCAAVCLQ
jgi:hypothetical protein